MAIRPSIFDRLTDEHPNLTREVYVNSWEEERLLHVSLCRDLTALLNTRRNEKHIPPEYKLVAASICNFGIPDFTAYTLTDPLDQERTQRTIEQTIRQFEPRLTNVHVALIPLDPNAPVRMTLEFQIDAVLRVEPYEPLHYTAVLRRESRQFGVTDATQ